jgi:hypothetical protein
MVISKRPDVMSGAVGSRRDCNRGCGTSVVVAVRNSRGSKVTMPNRVLEVVEKRSVRVTRICAFS